MLNDSAVARYLRETRALAEALKAAALPGAPADPRAQLQRCLRTYLDCLLESRTGCLYLPGGKPSVLPSDDATAEFALHELRRTITERFLVCASGSDRSGRLTPLVEGWLALAESMFRDWLRSGTPCREALETVICDLFFAAVDVARSA